MPGPAAAHRAGGAEPSAGPPPGCTEPLPPSRRHHRAAVPPLSPARWYGPPRPSERRPSPSKAALGGETLGPGPPLPPHLESPSGPTCAPALPRQHLPPPRGEELVRPAPPQQPPARWFGPPRRSHAFRLAGAAAPIEKKGARGEKARNRLKTASGRHGSVGRGGEGDAELLGSAMWRSGAEGGDLGCGTGLQPGRTGLQPGCTGPYRAIPGCTGPQAAPPGTARLRAPGSSPLLPPGPVAR